MTEALIDRLVQYGALGIMVILLSFAVARLFTLLQRTNEKNNADKIQMAKALDESTKAITAQNEVIVRLTIYLQTAMNNNKLLPPPSR